MTEPTPLFRQEALDSWTRQRGPGAMLRIGVPWMRWLYWIVLALVVAGLTLAFSARVHERASGPTLVDARDGTFIALLPAVARSSLERGRPLRVEIERLPERREVAARALRVESADAVDARQAGFGSFPQPAVLVTGVLGTQALNATRLPTSPRLEGRAVIVLRSERMLTAFLRGVEGAL